MSATLENVLRDALHLPIDERCFVAARRLESVDAGDDADFSPEWREEISRRIAAARTGASRRIPHEEVMASARALLAAARPAQV